MSFSKTATLLVILTSFVSNIAMGEEKKAVPANSKLPAGVTTQQTATGPILADGRGLTVYVFDKDTVSGSSACNGNCAKAWPPLAVPADSKPVSGWTQVAREDGTKQWAYKGKPLYTFDHWDTKPGDTNGDGVGGIWHVVKP
jgi:predicted lipoprotein with Yx(FWY)xxD motif